MEEKKAILYLYEKYSEDFKKTENAMHASKELFENIEKFNTHLDKDLKKEFEKIQELFFELVEEESKESFCDGYCLGVNLTIEALRKDEIK